MLLRIQKVQVYMTKEFFSLNLNLVNGMVVGGKPNSHAKTPSKWKSI